MRDLVQAFNKAEKNKIIAALLVAIIILLIALIAMVLINRGTTGGADKTVSIAGHYEIESIKDSSEGGTSEEALKLMKSMGLTITLDLNNDGTGTMDTFGEVAQVHYDLDRKILLINGDELPYTCKNGKLTIEQNSAVMVFRK